ncbi:hypothetical protein BS50DRAFT_573508 [Corynespora cassiicola Philippines]|uniref:HMG box domain-containing protein n=1 Tax=Corynespora cassiicola Philippines TaxID=1448308 RepID=A0A2T2NML9_CORCC|nr:hypothetical protein BS50DRAFT_573508 [Corynespora cassiicola Philippines]
MAQEAPANPHVQQVIVSLMNLQSGLAHVQTGLGDLLRAYMNHTNSILQGEDGAAIESLQLPATLQANANAAIEATTNAVNGLNQAAPAVAASLHAAAAAPEQAGKKKRKREKKEKDPNAPKRPLTAAFLYAQAARPVVRRDLEACLGPGEKLEPNSVNMEVTKRWNEMSEEDKEQWKASYRQSMEKFKEEYAAYMANTGVNAPELHDALASDEAEGGALDSDVESADEDEALPTPVAKAPSPPAAKTPRANKRQKTASTPAANGTAAHVAIAPATAATPVPLPKQSAAAAAAAAAAAEAPVTAPAKKERKKKAAPQAIAPAPGKDASPEETKKKAKGARSTRNTEAEAEPEKENVKEKEVKPTKKRDRSKRKSEGTAA